MANTSLSLSSKISQKYLGLIRVGIVPIPPHLHLPHMRQTTGFHWTPNNTIQFNNFVMPNKQTATNLPRSQLPEAEFPPKVRRREHTSNLHNNSHPLSQRSSSIEQGYVLLTNAETKRGEPIPLVNVNIQPHYQSISFSHLRKCILATYNIMVELHASPCTHNTSRKGAPDETTADGSNAQNYAAGITSLGNCLVKGTFSTSAVSYYFIHRKQISSTILYY
jgi:hypothetical protein